MTRISLKRVLVWLSLVLLSTLTAHSQTLCVIDGTPIPDSLLHITIDEMCTDSAKQIVAKRLGLIPPQAIESIQILPAEELIKQGKNITFCKSPADIIDYKLSPQRIMAALPKDINPSDIVSVDILTYTNDPRLERHPTLVIKTKCTAPSKNKRH